MKPKYRATRLDNCEEIIGYYVELECNGYIEHLIYTGKYRENMPDFPERFDVVPESVVKI